MSKNKLLQINKWVLKKTHSEFVSEWVFPLLVSKVSATTLLEPEEN